MGERDGDGEVRRARRLLVLCSQGGTGGTQRVAIGVAAHMADRGWHTRLLFPEVPEGGDLLANAPVLRAAHEAGVRAAVHPAVLNRVAPRTGASMRALRRLIRQERPDVVNFHYGWSQVPLRDVVAARLAGVRRVVVSLHLPVPWEEMGEQARRRTRWAAALSSAVVPCSEAVAEVALQAGIPDRKLYVVPGGVRPPGQANVDEPAAVEAARDALGVPRDAFVVTCVARMSPEKAQADLVQAVAALAAGAPAPYLVLQGDGPDRIAIETLCADLLPGRVRFLAGDAPTEPAYRAADVFALSSHAEGWPLVLMEAAGYGLPAVATSVGGVADQVPDGTTGLLSAPGDVPALARALGRLRADPALRGALGRAARDRALGEFHVDRMGERYHRVLAGGRGTRADLFERETAAAAPSARAAVTSGGRSE